MLFVFSVLYPIEESLLIIRLSSCAISISLKEAIIRRDEMSDV